MEYNEIIKKIEEYNKIIIMRHKNPDLDAYGSQNGLYEILKLNYPEKEIYMVGDENNLNFFRKPDVLTKEDYADALLFILDVSVTNMIDEEFYKYAKEIIIIDHHKNETTIENSKTLRLFYSSCAEIIAEFALKSELKLNKESAIALYAGIVSDSGRFFYSGINSNTFKMASFLLEQDIDIQSLYNKMYIEPLNLKRLKAYFILNFKLTKNSVAYMINKKELSLEYNVSTFTVSRGMVNQMAGIEGVRIWVNFTENPTDDNILVEIRSNNIVVVDIAKKYGGGGHDFACGCQAKDLDIVEKILNDLDERAGEYK